MDVECGAAPWPRFVLDVLREFEIEEILDTVEGDAGRGRLGGGLLPQGRAGRAIEVRQFRSPLELVVHWAAVAGAPTVGALRAAIVQAPFPVALGKLDA